MAKTITNLRARVKADGLRETARQIGLSPSYISELLKGTRKPGKKARAALEAVK
jgi:transcriptional regulator with XRE-family HTH domain